MLPDLTAAGAELHRQDLLREAAHQRLAARVAGTHPWRTRLGRQLIKLGERLTQPSPADRPAHRRTRIA